MKSINEIMTDDSSCLLYFDKACDELISSKFILADAKISALLQVIAGSKKLYEIVESCMKDFDFPATLAELKRSFDGKDFMPVPFASRKKNIALVFCLLYSFDTKKLDLQDFLSSYFYSDSTNHEFKKFCDAMIVPFRKNIGLEFIEEENGAPQIEEYGDDAHSGQTGELVNAPAIVGSSELSAPADKPASKAVEQVRPRVNFSLGDDDEPIDDRILTNLQAESLLVCIREIIGIVAREPSLSVREREELLIILEAFEKAVDFGGVEAVKVLYIGVKNTIACSSIYRQLQLQEDSLEMLIKEYGI